jgi:hypothetical protein
MRFVIFIMGPSFECLFVRKQVTIALNLPLEYLEPRPRPPIGILL